MHAFIFWGFLVLFPTIVEAMLAIVDPRLDPAAARSTRRGSCSSSTCSRRSWRSASGSRSTSARCSAPIGSADRIWGRPTGSCSTILGDRRDAPALERHADRARAERAPDAQPVANALSDLFAGGRRPRSLERVFVWSHLLHRARLPDLPAEVEAPAHHHGGAERLLREERARAAGSSRCGSTSRAPRRTCGSASRPRGTCRGSSCSTCSAAPSAAAARRSAPPGAPGKPLCPKLLIMDLRDHVAGSTARRWPPAPSSSSRSSRTPSPTRSCGTA